MSVTVREKFKNTIPAINNNEIEDARANQIDKNKDAAKTAGIANMSASVPEKLENSIPPLVLIKTLTIMMIIRNQKKCKRMAGIANISVSVPKKF